MIRRPAGSVVSGTAVVTGAGSGIGSALATLLAQRGLPLAIADCDGAALAQSAARLRALGVPVLARELDVRDRDGQRRFAADVAEWAPQPVGLVVANAGVTVLKTAVEASHEDDEWVLDINLRGAINTIRSFLPAMIERGSGTVVAVSSICGLAGFPNQASYSASKFGLRGYTEALRHELRGTGVRVCCAHPGGVKTGIIRNSRFGLEGETRQQAADSFERRTGATAERAAQGIVAGVEGGRTRIIVGPDARAIDLLARALPERWFDVVAAGEALGRRVRQRSGAA